MIQNFPFQQLLPSISHLNLLRPIWFHKHICILYSAYLFIYLKFYIFIPIELKISRYHLHLLFWDVSINWVFFFYVLYNLVYRTLQNSYTYIHIPVQYIHIQVTHTYRNVLNHNIVFVYNLSISYPFHLSYINLCIHHLWFFIVFILLIS